MQLLSPSLKTRILSGFLLAPVAVFIILSGGWLFNIFMAAIFVLSYYEWYKLCVQGDKVARNLVTGFIYIGICCLSFVYMRNALEQGAWLTLCAILCVWASDIGAYFTGKIIGGPKLAPGISPNKTISGLCGAMFFCGLSLVVLFFMGPLFSAYMQTMLNITASQIVYVFLSGCILGFIGQAGDLFISAMKRRVGAKDTGQLIPGHGGILDRIDSLMLVSPAFLSFVMLWAL